MDQNTNKCPMTMSTQAKVEYYLVADKIIRERYENFPICLYTETTTGKVTPSYLGYARLIAATLNLENPGKAIYLAATKHNGYFIFTVPEQKPTIPGLQLGDYDSNTVFVKMELRIATDVQEMAIKEFNFYVECMTEGK